MKIAVIDDERYARDELIHQIKEIMPDASVFEASSGVEAVELIEQQKLDILFVDIHLCDMLGTTIASLARRLLPESRIIFATAFAEYGVQAFELGVDNYLLKPFAPDRVRQVLTLCQTARTLTPAPKEPLPKIAVLVNRRTVLLNLEDIVYIETSGTGHQCVLYTKEKTYTTTSSLGEYEARLKSQGFFRIHKTCLVQLRLIQDIFSWTNNGYALHMQGFDCILPIGRNRVKELRQRLHL
ncbi:MAG: LytR/AlgR family response regulator transcription factor [Pygmaiobacter massiliensis]|uniref:LytR/AlgR family response regulator transcription factor n=1 Tax=Pygmaiobacter massiliensis TaxID=1917873 RepID=UPI000C7D202B|nr:LytTR family DNA-binding domain-containing protein [Pygmaiobacter massiliensis]